MPAVVSGFADTIFGSDAANTVAGGLGNDTLSGGGADLFVYAAGDGDDSITDFSAGEVDKVDLTDVGFTGTSATANVAVLSDGATIIAQSGYVWTPDDFV